MVGSLGVTVYFKLHACLAASVNIQRRNQSTSLVKLWRVMSRQLIQSAYGIADGGGF